MAGGGNGVRGVEPAPSFQRKPESPFLWAASGKEMGFQLWLE
jgi:hypothetical protein